MAAAVTATLAAAPVHAAVPAGNLTANPSFEADLTGWAGWQGSLVRVGPVTAPDGQYVARVSHTGGTSYSIGDSPASAPSTAGAAYTAEARVRAANTATAGRPVSLIVRERTTGGTVVRQTTSSPVTLTSGFQTLRVVATGAGSGNRIDVRISQASAASGHAFDVDLFTLTTGSATTSAPPAPAPAPAPSAGGLPSPELLPYDPQALFNQTITGRSVHSRSAAIAANMAQNARTLRVNASFDGEVPPIHIGRTTDPVYTVTVAGRTERVRLAAGAQPGAGADHPLVVLNPQSPERGRNVELRVWQASINHSARTISGSSSGLFHYNNDGAILNPNGTRSVSLAFAGNGTGSNLSYLAGLLRPSDIGSGRIRHAVRIAIGCNDFTSAFVAPATKTDQNATRCNGASTPAAGKVDMGMRMRLPAGLDCGARLAPVLPGRTESTRETQFLRILCRGIQEYGLIVLDGTGADGIIIYMEDGATANWSSVAGQPLYGGYGYIVRDSTTPSDGLSRTALHGIPWGSLQTVD